LTSLLETTPSAGGRVRVIRAEAVRAIVEVEHRTALHTRQVWNAVVSSPNGERWEITTKRTWGTLVGAKSWLRERRKSSAGPRRGGDRALIAKVREADLR
jgi:hypothetical protein